VSAIAAAVDRNLEIIRELELLGSEFKANEALIVSQPCMGNRSRSWTMTAKESSS
jgi:hypothetical protein